MPTATVVITSTPAFEFSVSLSDGSNYTFKELADTQNSAIDLLIADLNAIITAVTAQKTPASS
jgi:hypothetical protein